MSYSSYSEIAREMGVTRMCVAQQAKSGLRKIYKRTAKLYPSLTPLEILRELCIAFNLEGKDKEEFLRSFPSDVKELVRKNINNN